MKVLISGKNKLVVRMSGKLNEHADLEMITVPQADAVEIDLSELILINSMGIRNLRDWLLAIKAPVLTFSYCPRVFIDQVNMVLDFIPKHSKILSFYVPYYGDSSGEDKAILFTRGEQFTVTGDSTNISWPQVFDSKGKEMDVDVVGDRYFGFLKKF